MCNDIHCRVSVWQDGSCNGLQHYAALGRDWLGAKQVNLTPGDRPQDPYAGVAAMVPATSHHPALTTTTLLSCTVEPL